MRRQIMLQTTRSPRQHMGHKGSWVSYKSNRFMKKWSLIQTTVLKWSLGYPGIYIYIYRCLYTISLSLPCQRLQICVCQLPPSWSTCRSNPVRPAPPAWAIPAGTVGLWETLPKRGWHGKKRGKHRSGSDVPCKHHGIYTIEDHE